MGKRSIPALMLFVAMFFTWSGHIAAQYTETSTAKSNETTTGDNEAEFVEEEPKESDSKSKESEQSETSANADTSVVETEADTETDETEVEESATEETAQNQSSEETSESQPATEVEEPTVEEDHSVEVEPEKEDTTPPKQEKDPVAKKKHVIGATALVMEKQSEILFSARVDSGAKSCSLHVEQIKIDNEAETWADNIGKVIHFEITNGKGKKHWLKSKIANYVIIKTSNSRERRYKVPLTFQWKDMEKKVLVTLNNRKSMEFPLLIGRNFLRGDFVVDVEIDSND